MKIVYSIAKMKKTILYLVVLSAVAVAVSSCGAAKRLGYLQDMVPDVTYDMPLQPEAIIAKGDRMNITVYCSTPALAAPFNLSTGVSTVDPVSSNIGTEIVSAADNSYEVDNSGQINFPVFGKITVEGRTLTWLKEYLESELTSRKYIKDPVVTVGFSNFKYTIIGEISSGVHYEPSGKINIIDALANAGEPGESAVRNDIRVVRTVDGQRRMYSIDLTSKDCFYSPVFFLQQNDLIYVKPRADKHDDKVNNTISTSTTIFTAITTLVNTFLWYKLYVQ